MPFFFSRILQDPSSQCYVTCRSSSPFEGFSSNQTHTRRHTPYKRASGGEYQHWSFNGCIQIPKKSHASLVDFRGHRKVQLWAKSLSYVFHPFPTDYSLSDRVSICFANHKPKGLCSTKNKNGTQFKQLPCYFSDISTSRLHRLWFTCLGQSGYKSQNQRRRYSNNPCLGIFFCHILL